MADDEKDIFSDDIDTDFDKFTETKVNPDYFLFMNLHAIEKLFQSVGKTPEDINSLHSTYALLIERLEVKMESLGKLPKDYKDRIEQYKKGDEFVKAKDDFTRTVRLAIYKEKLIQEQIAKMRYLTAPVAV
jgi:hypothetical protein